MDPLHTIQASGRYDHCESVHIWGKSQYFTVFDFFRHLLVKIRRSDQFYAILQWIARLVKILDVSKFDLEAVKILLQ